MTNREGVCICGAAVAAHYDRWNRRLACLEVRRLAEAQAEALAQAGEALQGPVTAFGELVPPGAEADIVGRLRAFEPWPEIERRKVNSSNIVSIGFSMPDLRLRTGLLDVEFVNGSVYRYFDVPASVHAAIMSAPSIGGRFAALVKAAGFEAEQLRAPRPTGPKP